MRQGPLLSILFLIGSSFALVNCGDDDATDGDTTGGSNNGGESSSGGSSAGENSGGDGNGEAGGGTGGNATGGGPAGGSAGSTNGGSSSSGGDGGGGEPQGGSDSSGGSTGEGGSGAVATGGQNGEGGAGGEASGGTTGLLVRYDFEEESGTTITDSSGNGFDATLSHAEDRTEDGRNGGAVALTGGLPATSNIALPNGILSGVTELTIATWVKLDSAPPWSRIFELGNPSNRWLFLAPNVGTPGMRFSVFGGAPEQEATVVTNAEFPLGAWKHVAVTASGNEYSIYVDGFPAGHITNGPAVALTDFEPMGEKSWIGRSRFLNELGQDVDPGMDGMVDEFAMYDHVLSPNEIRELAWPKSDYTALHFDEADGTDAEDGSGRAMDATLMNASWTAGREGAAALLNGTDGYVAFDSDPVQGCTEAFTFSAWVKLNASQAWARIFDFNNDTSWMFLTARAGNNLQLNIFKPGETETVVTSATSIPTDGEFHHVAVTVSSAAATLFLDGVELTSAANPILPSELGAFTNAWLGRSKFPADPYLDAAIDEVRISCRAYTAGEIKSLSFK